jgi:diguanylate cyclase (GGDEF)-like protein
MGHLVGDEVLKKIGELLKYGYTCEKFSYLPRKTDTVCRWGGEEFVFLLWDTNGEAGRIFTDKIRKIIESMVFQNMDGSEF